jgi:hypothetical protein
MTQPPAGPSPLLKARIAGALYLLTILVRVIADAFVRNRLVVSDDVAATATNIMAQEPLFRLGFAAGLLAFASYVALTAILYELFKPVNKSLFLSYVAFLSPPFARSLQPYILISSGVGQVSLRLWLLVMSANAQRWDGQATATGVHA